MEKSYVSIEESRLKNIERSKKTYIKKKFNITSLENINIEELKKNRKEEKLKNTSKAKEDRCLSIICDVCGGKYKNIAYNLKEHIETKKHKNKMV